MGVLDTVSDISSILSEYEKSKAQGNLAQAGAQQNQANAAANIYRTQSAVALNGPQQSAKAAALGDQMSNIQPFKWTGDTSQVGNIPVPQSSGGLTPANFGPDTRRAGAALSSLSADRVSSPTFNLPTPPTLAPLPELSAGDGILSKAATIGSLAKAASGGSGSGGDIGKAAKAIWDKLHPASGQNVQGNQPFPGGALPSGNPDMNGFTGWDDPQAAPTPSVDTSYDFNNDPNLGANGGTDDQGGYYDAAGNYIDPYAQQGENAWFGEPGPEWGG